MARSKRRLARSMVSAIGLLVVSALPGCGLINLVFVPIDLLNAHVTRPLTENSDAGPVESVLVQRARSEDALDLVRDTRDPKADPKRLARACDQGDDFSCAIPGSLLFFSLGEAGTGLALLERACRSGHVRACEQAGDGYSASYRDEFDPGRAAESYRIGCEAAPEIPRLCTRLVETLPPYSGALQFALLDMTCENGDRESCQALVKRSAGWPIVEYYERLAEVGGLEDPRSTRLVEVALRNRAYSRKQVPELWSAFQEIEEWKAEYALLERRRDFRARLAPSINAFPPSPERTSSMTIGGHRQSIPEECKRADRPPELCLRLAKTLLPTFVETEVDETCLSCADRCALPPTPLAWDGCLCACVRDQGGCGIPPDALDQCVENAR